jgi:hypothetical protein
LTDLRKAGRSEIPFDDLAAVLIANRFTCCVCHAPSKSIIVHHIKEWAYTDYLQSFLPTL